MRSDAPGPRNDNALITGFDKIINRYYFTGNLNYEHDFGWGAARVDQRYRGTVLPLSRTVVRDEETFRFGLEIPLAKKFSLIADQNWILSTDSRSIGLNDLERLNGLVGLRYRFDEFSFIEALAGGERNSQVGVVSPGSIFRLNGAVGRYEFEGYDINSALSAQLLNLDNDRTNSDLAITAGVNKNYDLENTVDIGMRYKAMNRDFLTPLNISGEDINSVESRFENRISANLNFDYAVTDLISAAAVFRYEDFFVEKSYKQYFEELPTTGIERFHRELNLTIDARTVYMSENFMQQAGIYFNNRNEDNSVENKYGIYETEEQRLRRIENQRDVVSSRTRFISRSRWNMSRSDTLALDYSVSILRYDTPSDLNNSDRDEFNTIVGLRYGHRFSEHLSASLLAELQMLHMVYLKSEMSGNNNWNRILRLSPSVALETDIFSMHPSFEVLANYTIFDYRALKSGIKDLSFRQIRYQDSIIVYLQKNLSLQSKINFRYYESGILYWKDFSEIPMNSNMEQLAKVFAVVRLSQNTEIGCGARYYRVRQESLSKQNAGISAAAVDILSIGPEAMISANITKNLKISISGWYEFQTLNKFEKKEIPNLFLQTFLSL